jgi:flagellar biosynthesis/type III secretory pathway M-ring protein FliF/YscJ
LSVLAVPFEAVTPPVEETAENPVAGKPKPDIMYIVERVGRIVVGAIAVVALLILALRALKTPVGGATPMSASLFSQESPRSAQMTAVSGPAPVEAPPPPPPPPPITIDANMRPEQTAQVLRDWLTRSA